MLWILLLLRLRRICRPEESELLKLVLFRTRICEALAVLERINTEVIPTPESTHAMQWAEGMIFKAFLTEGRIPSMSEMPMLTRDEYLGGVLDFTGELNRYAVMRATERDIAAVKKCRDVVDSLMGIFLEVRIYKD